MPRVERAGWGCAVLLAAVLSARPAEADELSEPGRSVVVLVGPAGRADLAALLREFLTRAGVDAAIETREAFDPDGVTAPTPHIVITLPTPRTARIYYRIDARHPLPPRDLALPNGLDEVGRETIANVVESSSIALLRDLDEKPPMAIPVRADPALARSSESVQDPARQPAAAARSSDLQSPARRARPAPSRIARAASRAAPGSAAGPPPTAAEDTLAGEVSAQRAGAAYEVGLRGLGAAALAGSRWDVAAGLELGRIARITPRYVYRIRLVYEYMAQTTLGTSVVDASLAPMALRAGLDLGATHRTHALALGVGLGVDLIRITPRRVDSGWELSPAHTVVSPVLRLELRYELALGPVLLGAAVFSDVSLLGPRYEVRSATSALSVATPSWWRPGIALSVGLRLPALAAD